MSKSAFLAIVFDTLRFKENLLEDDKMYRSCTCIDIDIYIYMIRSMCIHLHLYMYIIYIHIQAYTPRLEEYQTKIINNIFLFSFNMMKLKGFFKPRNPVKATMSQRQMGSHPALPSRPLDELPVDHCMLLGSEHLCIRGDCIAATVDG